MLQSFKKIQVIQKYSSDPSLQNSLSSNIGNIFILGKTGSGKSELANRISNNNDDIVDEIHFFPNRIEKIIQKISSSKKVIVTAQYYTEILNKVLPIDTFSDVIIGKLEFRTLNSFILEQFSFIEKTQNFSSRSTEHKDFLHY